jgi:hypothetical protein
MSRLGLIFHGVLDRRWDVTTSKRVARETGKQPERPATPEKVKETGAPAESRDKGGKKKKKK